ncbi:MAG TPA: hypothetical protein VFH68_19160 [Polyangia bacterium]|nr:hypothetical protein [Polyangia bacterium]
MLLSLLITGGSCQQWMVASIELEGEFDPDQISSVEARVDTPDGFAHDSAAPPNAAFKRSRVVGIYLPTRVTQFTVQVVLFDLRDCPSLTGSKVFTLNVHNARLVMPLTQLSADDCPRVSDAGHDADTRSDADDTLAERNESPDGPPDLVDGGSDQAECSSGEDAAEACFDLADAGGDAGTPQPIAQAIPNPECRDYCSTVTSACHNPFADFAECLAVCTTAGWHLPTNGGDGTVLSCLANSAHHAAALREDLRSSDCIGADPSSWNCGKDGSCEGYCALREAWCPDSSNTKRTCLTDCLSLSRERFGCLMHVMQHDVPSDSRFCSLAAVATTCGQCRR